MTTNKNNDNSWLRDVIFPPLNVLILWLEKRKKRKKSFRPPNKHPRFTQLSLYLTDLPEKSFSDEEEIASVRSCFFNVDKVPQSLCDTADDLFPVFILLGNPIDFRWIFNKVIFLIPTVIDVDDVKFVINYDFPGNIEDYVHRIGRTGRSNNKGTSYTFFTQSNGAKVDELVNILQETNQVRSVNSPSQHYKF